MRNIVFCLPALLIAGAAAAQGDARPDPRDPKAKVPPAEYRSAFADYRAFAEQQAGDWRKANEAVREAGGHAGMHAGHGAGKPAPKPQPGAAK